MPPILEERAFNARREHMMSYFKGFVSVMSYKVVVPGHGDMTRVSELHASLETLYNNTRFDNCEVYVQNGARVFKV